uniref:N/A n=1 Tax=Ganoderma boninense TaxID=34458 RepID=A0A5K1K5Q0_9APHY|nr:N/A [Ganoderma boninense]
MDSTTYLLADKSTLSTQGPMMPTSPPRRSTERQEEPPVQTIYMNLDFPAPTSQWEGVFDVCIRGDAQAFARLLDAELEKEKQVKEPEVAKDRKRKREETAAEKMERK